MFTVKWVVKHTLGEVTRIFQAEEVAVAYRDQSSVHPKPWQVAGRDVHEALFMLNPYSLDGRSFSEGLIYVMNEQGATVGKYCLSNRVFAEPDGLPLPDAAPVLNILS